MAFNVHKHTLGADGECREVHGLEELGHIKQMSLKDTLESECVV